MAPQQSAKFRTAFSGQFRTSLRKDSVANYASIWTLFSTSVTGPDVLCNALNISQIHLYMAPQDSKIAVEILQSVNNRTQSMRKILRMVITDIVINTLLGRVTRHPAGMHCSARVDAFVSSCCCYCCSSCTYLLAVPHGVSICSTLIFCSFRRVQLLIIFLQLLRDCLRYMHVYSSYTQSSADSAEVRPLS